MESSSGNAASQPSVNVLTDVPLIAMLPPDLRDVVMECFEPVEYQFGDEIFHEGDPGDAFYVITKGSVRLVVAAGSGEINLTTLSAGAWFGEAALLEDKPRKATVRARNEVELLRLDGSVFVSLLDSHPEIREQFQLYSARHDIFNLLRVHSAFSELSAPALVRLLMGLTSFDFAEDEVVVRQGDVAGPMFIVQSGRLVAFVEEDGKRRVLEYYRPGDIFGELSLFSSAHRAATVQALEPVKLLALGESAFRSLLDSDTNFRERIAEFVSVYEANPVRRVPLDFADLDVPDTEPLRPIEGIDAETHERMRGGMEIAPPIELGAKVDQKAIRKFPHIFQIDEMDCGAASLAMVCIHFGHDIDRSYIREIVGTNIDGTSLTGIVNGARQIGLDARGVKVSKDRLDTIPLPAIVHWDNEHWVVLWRVTDRRVYVADPGVGIRHFSRDEFLKHWSGYTVLTQPTQKLFEQPLRNVSTNWFRRLVEPFQRRLTFAVLLGVVAAFLEIVLPFMTVVLFDTVVPHHNYTLLGVVAIAAIFGVVLSFVTVVVQSYLMSSVAVRVDQDSLQFVTSKLFSLPLQYALTRTTGDLMRRINGLQTVREFFIRQGVQLVSAIAQIVVAIGAMFFISVTLAIIYLATLPFYMLLTWLSIKYIRPLYATVEEAWGRYMTNQTDALKGFETMKVLGAEKDLLQNMLDRFKTVKKRVFKLDLETAAFSAAISNLTILAWAVFIVVGAYEVTQNDLSLGKLIAFNTIVLIANGPVILTLSAVEQFQQVRTIFNRINDVIEHQPEQGEDHSKLKRVDSLAGRVELRDLSFRYGGTTAQPIIRSISFSASPGDTIAVVGRSGSGKTTLVKLLSGLLEPTGGEILYDGVDLKTIDYSTLRSKIGFVLQDSQLFSDSIIRNIVLGGPEIDYDRVAWAIKMANLEDFISDLPLGYETLVGERGMSISGGEKQRLSIARALYRRPAILILDEATSALDLESERVVKQNLDDLSGERTTFVIAHRLSTIRNATNVIVLDQGAIVEQGTHDELLKAEGLYHYLVNQQLEL